MAVQMKNTNKRSEKSSKRKQLIYTVETILGVKFKLIYGTSETFTRTGTKITLPSYKLANPADLDNITASFKQFEIILPDTRLTNDRPSGVVLIYIDPTGLVTRVIRT
jgi:hypothetical protein